MAKKELIKNNFRELTNLLKWQSAILAGIIALIVLGIWYLKIHPAQAAAPWPSSMAQWTKRKQLTLVNNSGQNFEANTTYAITLDTQALAQLSNIQSDCDDLRIFYQPNSGTATELRRTYELAYGATSCADSAATKIYFSLQAGIATGASSTDYYIYWGNDNATAPSNTDDAFNISSKNATFVCPLNGNTTCVASETPSTSTGAVRYLPGKSALLFDGYNDYVSVGNVYNGIKTVEFWIYPYSNTNYFIDLNGTAYISASNGTISATGFTNPTIYVNGYQGTSLSVYSWQHVAVVTDTAINASSVNIGKISTNYLNGRMDELRLSSIVRYTGNFSPQTSVFIRDPDTKLLFHFDEAGDDPRQSGKTIDDSGNDKHGTVTGTKYINGLIGIDSSNTNFSGRFPSISYVSHQGIFIEQGTTNKIPNPSFEYPIFNNNWSEATITPDITTVSSSTDVANATAFNYQRKVWYDGTRMWLTFDDGTNMRFFYSTNGTSWSENSGASFSTTNGTNVSIWGDSSNLYYVRDNGLDIIIAKASSYPSTSFSWSSTTIVFDGTGANDAFNTPVIAQDSSGYIWVGAGHYDGTNTDIWFKRSTNANDISSWDSETEIASYATSTSYALTIVPLNNGDMYAISGESGNMYGCFYDAQSSARWEDSSGNDCTSGTYKDTIGTDLGLTSYFSAVSDNTNYDVHLIYRSNSDSRKKYVRWDNSSGVNGAWQTAVNIDGSVTTSINTLTISIDTTTSDLYAMFFENTTGYARYIMCDVSAASSECSSSSDWSSAVTFATLNTNSRQIISNFSGPSRILAAITDGTSSPYPIKAKLILGTPPTIAENTAEPYYKFGSRSAKMIASSGDATLVSVINPGNTNNHILSAYVYNATSGEAGSAIDATVAKLIFNSSDQTTTYTDVGGGWWRLSYSGAGVNSLGNYGVKVMSGKTVYIDGLQLEEKNTITSYADGTLGVGYSWTGTEHNSATVRSAADVRYATSGNISSSAGTISLWLKPTWAGNDNAEHTFLDVDTTSGSFKLYKTTGNNLVLTNGTNNATLAVGWTANTWQHIAAVWGSGTMNVYLNGTAGTSAAYSPPTFSTSLYIGQSKTNTSQADAVISDLRIYDSVLTAAEIADIYYASLGSFQQSPTLDNYAAGQPPVLIWHLDEGYGTTAYDASPWKNTGTLGTGSSAPSFSNEAINGLSLKFDGSNDYIYRSYNGDSELDVGTENFSVSTWFRHSSTAPTTSTIDVIIARYASSGYKIYMNDNGYICFGIDDDSSWGPDDSACSTTSYADSQWHHVEGVKTSSSITLYIDGRQVAQDNSLLATGSLSGSSPTLYAGIDSDGATGSWDGWLDEIYVYDSAHTSTQVTTIFNSRGSMQGVSSAYGFSQKEERLTNGLIGYWKFDESSGNASDSSGNSYTLTNNHSTAYTGGKFANGAQADGTNDYFSYSGSIAGIKTISFWVYPTSNTNYYLNLKNSPATNITSSSGTVSATGFTSPTIYVNGVANGTVSASSWNLVTVATETAITADVLEVMRAGGSYLTNTSKIDEVRLYSRVLSPQEIQLLYDWGPPPVAYWKMDENTGTSIMDITGNGHTGNFGIGSSAPTWTQGKMGGGIKFNNNYSYISSNDVFGNIGTGEFTIAVWIKELNQDVANTMPVIFRQSDSDDYPMITVQRDRRTALNHDYITLNLYNAAGTQNTVRCGRFSGSGTSLGWTNDGKWHHFIGQRNSSSLVIYIDGRLCASSSNTSLNIDLSPYQAYIGNQVLTYQAWDGYMDELKIYNYARSPKQIIEDMNAGHPAVGTPVASAVGHWKFDEGYGTTAYNSGTGANINGTLGTGSSAPSWSNSGKFGKALSFDGSNDYVGVGNSAPLQITGNLTISSWINLTSTSSVGDIFAKRGSSGNYGYRLFTDSSGRLNMEVSSNGTTTTTVTGNSILSTGTWYHAVGVYIPSTSLTVYVNGIQDGQNTSSIPASIYNSTANGIIGAENDGASNRFAGIIDEVKIYNYALSIDDIKIDYNQSKAQTLGALGTNSSYQPQAAAQEYCIPGDSATCTPPVGEWKLDEKTGSSAYDTSGNGFTLSLLNQTAWINGKIGAGVTFDGTEDMLKYTDSTVNPLDITGSFSIGGWFRFSRVNVNNQTLVAKFATTSRTNYWLATDSGTGQQDELTCETTNSSGTRRYVYTEGLNLTTNTWYHIYCTYNSSNGNMYIYVNGVRPTQTMAGSTVTPTTGNQPFYIGGDENAVIGYGADLQGSADLVRVYNYERSWAQILYEFNRGAPIAWYKFDECTGSTAYNSAPTASGGAPGNNGTIYPVSSGNTSVGTCNSGTATEMWNNGTSGKINSSIDLDGSDDYILINDTVNLRFDAATQDFSLFAWVKRNTTGTTQYIISKEDADNDGWRLMFNSNNTVTCSQDATDVTSSSTIADNNWHHIGCTIDRDGNGQVYIDGKADGAAVAMGSDAMATTANIRLGTRSYTPTYYLDGQLDDVRIYNYALKSEQVKLLYNKDSAVSYGQ